MDPHYIAETIRYSAKVNVWYGLMAHHSIGLFFYAKSIVTKNVYLNMFRIFGVLQISLLHPYVLWQ